MKRKLLRILVPALVLILAAGFRLLRQLQKTEPVYFRTAACGWLTESLEDDPFTVYCWKGGKTYTPVFTEEQEQLLPRACAMWEDTLYYAIWTEAGGSQVYRADLETGQKIMLADLYSRVWELAANGEALFLKVYRSEGRCHLLVLRDGELRDCAADLGFSPISCGAAGCWYMEWDREADTGSLCYLQADTLIPKTVCQNTFYPFALQAAPDGVYCAWQRPSGGFRLVFYPLDGSGEKELLTELTPDGPGGSGKKQASFTGNMALWEDKLFYITFTAYSGWDEPDRDHWLHCLDLKTGKVTDYGKASQNTGLGAVRFPYLLSCGKKGFILTESDWQAVDAAAANRYFLYRWNGGRTELFPGEDRAK